MTPTNTVRAALINPEGEPGPAHDPADVPAGPPAPHAAAPMTAIDATATSRPANLTIASTSAG